MHVRSGRKWLYEVADTLKAVAHCFVARRSGRGGVWHVLAQVWGAHPRCAVSRLGEIACKAAPVGCVLLADAVGDTVRRLVGREASEETIEARTAERARCALDLLATALSRSHARRASTPAVAGPRACRPQWKN
eukprot:487675-Pleurochrysis_carterae.AAC.4